MNALIILAAESEVDPELQLLPETAELVWGVIAFGLLFGIIWRFALPSLNKMLDERQAAIQGKLEEAEVIRTEAEELRRKYSEQLQKARSRADDLVEQARDEAEQVRERKVAEAEDEAETIRQRARDDADAERGRIVSQLRGQVATLSVDLAGAIVNRELDEERHRALVDDYIDQLSSMN